MNMSLRERARLCWYRTMCPSSTGFLLIASLDRPIRFVVDAQYAELSACSDRS